MQSLNTTPAERYGTSTSVCDYIVQHQIKACRPASVVDFGAGAGKNGHLVRGALPAASCSLTAVEGFEGAARMLEQGGVYDRVECALIQDWVERDGGRYSLAIFGDVLEHLPPRQIHRVLRACFTKFDHIIIVVPLNDIFQDDVYGNQLEVHRAYVTPAFFDRYRPVEQHIVKGGGYTMMNVLIMTQETQRDWQRRALAVSFDVVMKCLQPIGLARSFVDLLKPVVRSVSWLRR
jgi:hypothetical protein